MKTNLCLIKDCPEYRSCKQLCDKHYGYLRRYGDANHKPRKYEKTPFASLRSKDLLGYKRLWKRLNGYKDERNSIKRYPQRQRAREILNYAVKSGQILRGKCEKCGSKKSEGHHLNYSRPLAVIWLCRRCHSQTHKRKVPIHSS